MIVSTSTFLKTEANKSPSKRRFVRYENRKIHEVGDRNSYVTMESLLAIVASGADVEITDDRTGQNCTVRTLSRLIYDQCRKDEDVYTLQALQALIMSSQRDAEESGVQRSK